MLFAENPTDTGLQLSEEPFPHGNFLLCCDTFTSVIGSVIPSS